LSGLREDQLQLVRGGRYKTYYKQDYILLGVEVYKSKNL
jgi:hypothetical protein